MVFKGQWALETSSNTQLLGPENPRRETSCTFPRGSRAPRPSAPRGPPTPAPPSSPPSPVTCRSGPGSCAFAPRAPHGCSASALVILRGAAASADCGARPLAPPPARRRCDRPPGSGLEALRVNSASACPLRRSSLSRHSSEPQTRIGG